MGKGVLAVVVCSLLAGCAHEAAQTKGQPLPHAAVAQAGRRYVDRDLGFEISRPSGGWQLDATDDQTADGISIPVVMRHPSTGAQVVVQVAPAIATPTQFAQRITDGLRSHPGFTTSEPEPLNYSDDAVGFQFAMQDAVKGRVAVMPGKSGRVYMVLATWPNGSSDAVPESVEQIFRSLQTL